MEKDMGSSETNSGAETQAGVGAEPGAGAGTENPFFAPSSLPYRLPPFAAIREEHYAPAFERGMAEQLEEVAAIAGDAAAPTFANTILALERSGALLRRALLVFDNQTAADTTPGAQALQAEFGPRFAAHQDAIRLDGRLFARIRAVYEEEVASGRDAGAGAGSRAEAMAGAGAEPGAEAEVGVGAAVGAGVASRAGAGVGTRAGTEAGGGLDAAGVRLVERYYADFVRAGALLGEAEKAQLRELNSELAVLGTEFERNLFVDTRANAVVIDSADELEGLSADAIRAAAANASARGLAGKYLLSLQLPSNQPLLAYLARRSVRERLYTASVSRGVSSNRELVARMARLRASRAALLGYESHAAYIVADQTARTVSAVESLLRQLVGPAVVNARREEELLRAAFSEDGYEPSQFAPWDWQYYAERVRRREYSIDAAQLRPYFELERVLWDGVFYAAGQVYGLRFEEREDLAGYRSGVRVFEVFEENGEPLGLFLGDYYARDSKRGGAWANALVAQSGLLGTRPVIANNLNLVKPASGEPTLLTFDEVRTMFHEFGHALHGLFSDVYAPRQAGARVPSDFVEYPSQVNEMWESWPEVLANYARHHETGEPIPAQLVARMEASARFGQGFKTVEYLGAALLDWAWHTIPAGAEPGDALGFEASALEDAGIAMESIPPRYRSTYFAHIWQFGYSAGYYSYIWSEVLDADTVEWFKENGGMTRANGDKFRRELLSKGDSVDPMAAFRAVRGRDPQLEALLVRRGLGA